MRSERMRALRACSHQGRNIGPSSLRTLGKREKQTQDSPTSLPSRVIRRSSAEKFSTENDEAREIFFEIRTKTEERETALRREKSHESWAPTIYSDTVRQSRQCFLIGHRRHDNERSTDPQPRSPYSSPDAQSRTRACESSICCSTRTKRSKVDFYLGVFFFSFTNNNFLLKNKRQLYVAVERCSR